jgi:hypothetical protein
VTVNEEVALDEIARADAYIEELKGRLRLISLALGPTTADDGDRRVHLAYLLSVTSNHDENPDIQRLRDRIGI